MPGSRANCARKAQRAVILSGGELTVTIRGKGRGGPNQEYALALAIALAGMPAVAALAGDTDGTDGGAGSASDPAGAFVDGETVAPRRPSASIPPPFLPTTIRPDSSPRWATCWCPGRPTPTSTTSAPSSLTGRDAITRKPRRMLENRRHRDRIALPSPPGAALSAISPRCAVAALLLLAASAHPAMADFRLCNNTGSRVGVAHRLQGRRRLDHRRLVERVGAHPAKPCCAARWSRATITSTRSTTTAAANGPATPSCARATRNSPFAAPRIAWRAATTAPASSRSIPASSAPGPCN